MNTNYEGRNQLPKPRITLITRIIPLHRLSRRLRKRQCRQHACHYRGKEAIADSKQRITRETKILFCPNQRNLRYLRFLLLENTLKQDFAAFVFFFSICSGQNHSGDAVLENRLMKIDRQRNRIRKVLQPLTQCCRSRLR